MDRPLGLSGLDQYMQILREGPGPVQGWNETRYALTRSIEMTCGHLPSKPAHSEIKSCWISILEYQMQTSSR